ncbi:proclotting enzyme-like [Neocloeon triangulifer]|uniref:proclotting enzyme-like n=1 Tax=Neocloeon triangulifer TaxID=2078957 RepID=UPI00286F281F|nr:proclotting enzyme-like [Neocloeon triangulifer]
MSLLIRGICALACVSQNIRPAFQQQQPSFPKISDRQYTTQPRSPCPEYFTYQSDNYGSGKKGVLSIQPPSDSTVITVLLELVLNTRLNENDFTGSLDLAENKDLVVQRLQQGDRSPIIYRVTFPLQNPLPSITKIVVNNRVVCSANPGNVYGYVTNLRLDHSLTSPVPIIFNSNSYPVQGGQNNPQPQRPLQQQGSQNPLQTNFGNPQPTPTRPPTRPTWITPIPATAATQPPQPQFQIETENTGSSKYQECGVSPQVSFLLVNGDSVAKGSWPWLSAIYDTTDTGLSFICGGTLVTNRHVITAAHCVAVSQGKATLKRPERVLVYLGKHNIVNFIERDAVPKEISSIVAHPQYTGKLDSAGVDLAVLTFETVTTFTAYIRPACLMDPNRQYSNTGNVVGWGRDEYGNPVSKMPRVASMPIVTNEECLRANPDFIRITSETTFCAGHRNGTGPCKGDSGGGLYVWDASSRKWSIRGVVSQSLWDNNINSCDLKNYVTFTDVSKLMPWVKQMTRQ